MRQQLGLVGNNTAMTCRKCKKKKEQTTRAVIWIEQVVGNHLLMRREASCCVRPNEMVILGCYCRMPLIVDCVSCSHLVCGNG